LFLFKKLLAPFFFPLPICIVILLLGLFLLWFTRRQKTGKIVVSLGVILLTILSYGTASNILLRSLEYKYPPLIGLEDVQDVKWVVVLGGGHTSDQRLPITSQLSDASIARLMEGIRLQRQLPGSKLLLSGGGVFDPIPTAIILADVAESIGVNGKDLVLESDSKDTKDETILVKDIVGNDRCILVTSAYHMPRSMALFKNLGMHPIPAPTDYFVKKPKRTSPGMFFPTAENLNKAERGVSEYLGLVWGKLRDQI